MVVLEIYSRCLIAKYKTYLFSKTTIFVLLLRLATIIAPLVIAYNSKGFWLKHDSFYEQPNVKFRGEYIFSAITNNLSSPVLCNNLLFLQKFTKFDKCSLVKVTESDYNNDGKADELQFSLTIETDNIKLLSFYLILTLDYSIHTVCPMQMQSAVILEYDCCSSSSELTIEAQLGLLQFNPLLCHAHKKNQDYNYQCISNIDTMDSKYDIKHIVQEYSIRNVSTHLINKHVTYSTKKSITEVLLNLRIKYPEHRFYHTVGFWQEMKWAWIQYFSLYVIFAWITEKIIKYVFDNRLLPFYDISPLKKIK